MVRSRAIHAPARMLVPINGNDLPAHQSHHTTPKQCILIISAKHPLVTVLVLIRVLARIGTSSLREAARARKAALLPAVSCVDHTLPHLTHSLEGDGVLRSLDGLRDRTERLEPRLGRRTARDARGLPDRLLRGERRQVARLGIVDARSPLR